MKFFKKKEVPRREVILGHCYEDDLLDAAEAEAREGNVNAAVTVLVESRDNAEARNLRATVLGSCLVGHAEEVAALGVRHRDPELLLLAGEAYTAEAWAIRGDGWGSTVRPDRARMFKSTLRKALGPLQTVAELLPRDPAPWAVMLKVGMGLSLSRPEQDEIWAETVKRAPYLYAAHWTRQQVVAEKWHGSHDEMHQFAVDTVNSAPPGDPVTSIMAAAFFEFYQAACRGADNRQDLWRLGERIFAESWDTIELASHKWLQDEMTHPRSLDAHNLFAGACGLAGDQDRTFVHLDGMRDRLAKRPWSMLADDPQDAYHRMVTKYWPKHLL